MGHVVVKYKVTINNPEDGTPDYQSIADVIDSFDEVQAVEIKPLAFGMMFIEVQVDGCRERMSFSTVFFLCWIIFPVRG